jgi:nicotinate-nucleotide adenylyltransferase
MARLNFTKTPGDSFPEEVILDLREVERARTQPNRPSYSFDTIQELRQHFPKLGFVIGTDQLEQLHTWYRFQDLLPLCHWIVLERKGTRDQGAHRTLQEWTASGLIQPFQSNLWRVRGSQNYFTLVSTDAPAISSTQIREAIVKTGSPPEDSLLPEVLGYLNDKKLYGM